MANEIRKSAGPTVLHNPTPAQLENAARKSEAELPPPGHKRDEVLAVRKDQAEQRAQEIADNPDAPRYIDEEVLRKKFAAEYHRYAKMLEHGSGSADPVRGKREDYYYTLVYAPLHMTHRPGAQSSIFEAAVRLGYERVTKSDPEGQANAPQLIDIEGSVRIGDAILMRIPRWKYEILVQLRDERAEKRAGNAAFGSLTSDLRQYSKFGRPLGSAEVAERMQAAAGSGVYVSPSNAMIDRWMKSGTIPGITPGE